MVKKFAKWIADLSKYGLIAGSFIPPLVIQQLHNLKRYHFKLTNFMSSENDLFQTYNLAM
ncbi:hypothetical protein Bbad01_38060 [Bacillus badius]|nr:hypothetical protein Bbad01_38060 [Bacillus badius]